MNTIRSFDEAEAALRPYRANTHMPYRLDTMRQLMTYLGEPQDSFAAVHIAGTSGKTSTAYYTAALLTAAGFKTGLTVSPQIEYLNERVQINMQPVPEAAYCAALAEFLKLVAQSGLKPSYFEVLVAFAYWEFARHKVDYAVVEVGLGGLLDGTNVISRSDKVCIITDIGFDHTKLLGNTLGEIAAQKAGIIQPGNEVFMYEQGREVMAAIEQTIKERGSRLHCLTKPDTDQAASQLPMYQQRNFTLARHAVAAICQQAERQLTADQLQQAADIIIPARMETRRRGPQTIILDGAHNQQKLAALRNTLHVKYPDQQIAALVAFSDGDEDRFGGALDEITRLSSTFIVTTFTTAADIIKQSVDPARVAAQLRERHCQAEVIESPAAAFQALLAQPEPVLLVTGSLYLLNHIRPLMLKV